MNYCVFYFATLLIMAAVDFLWLRAVARNFYQRHIGGMLEFRIAPIVLFYLVYTCGVVVFAGGGIAGGWQAVASHAALFGFFAYATYELTNMATLRGWSWAIVAVDIAWGTFNTGFSATCGWLIAELLARH